MTNLQHAVNQPLVYNGAEIAVKNEMLSLTDMWKASGAPANREPYNWARKEGGAFIAAVAIAHNLSDRQVMTKKRGKGGATLAHWQVGMAYAKYLNHDFHMWCNEVVRERMEGHTRDMIPADLREMIERSLGINKMLAHKVTEMEKRLDLIGTSDPVTGPAVEFLTSKQVMEDFGFKRGEIRGRAGQLTTRIRKFSMEHHHPLRLTSEMKRHLFHVDAVRDWMDAGGRDWLTAKLIEARSKAAGQGHLQLVS